MSQNSSEKAGKAGNDGFLCQSQGRKGRPPKPKTYAPSLQRLLNWSLNWPHLLSGGLRSLWLVLLTPTTRARGMQVLPLDAPPVLTLLNSLLSKRQYQPINGSTSILPSASLPANWRCSYPPTVATRRTQAGTKYLLSVKTQTTSTKLLLWLRRRAMISCYTVNLWRHAGDTSTVLLWPGPMLVKWQVSPLWLARLM